MLRRASSPCSVRVKSRSGRDQPTFLCYCPAELIFSETFTSLNKAVVFLDCNFERKISVRIFVITSATRNIIAMVGFFIISNKPF